MRWWTNWKQARLERRIYEALVMLKLDDMVNGNAACFVCDGNCELCICDDSCDCD